MRKLNARRRATALAGVVGLLGVALLCGFAQKAVAQAAPSRMVMASDEAAGYLVFPKIIVEDSTGSGTIGTDTLIQITNTARFGTDPTIVHCWYINANSHCDATGPVCETHADCNRPPPLGLPGTLCIPGWRQNDFSFTLTNEHPIGWLASTGRTLDVGNTTTLADGTVLGVQERPFRGELKCLQVDDEAGPPSPRNDLKGEATIISVQAPPDGGTPPRLTSASYNAIGFQADVNATGNADPDDPLCLGSLPAGGPAGVECAMTYAPCPNVLILNHFFEQANTPLAENAFVQTELTLVPCSERLIDFPDFRVSGPPSITAQMLVYNEFEQRFSTDARVQCYRNTTLSDIDTLAGPGDDQFSIFSAGVQGTLAGQTRIRGVTGALAGSGFGLIGVAQEFYSAAVGDPADASTAFNLHAAPGFRAEGDAVYNVNESPAGP